MVSIETPSFRVDDSVALVTGAGSGMGQAFSIALAQAGANIIVAELPGREAAAEETASEVRKAGRRCMICPMDVTDVATVRETVNQVSQQCLNLYVHVFYSWVRVFSGSADVSGPDGFDTAGGLEE